MFKITCDKASQFVEIRFNKFISAFCAWIVTHRILAERFLEFLPCSWWEALDIVTVTLLFISDRLIWYSPYPMSDINPAVLIISCVPPLFLVSTFSWTSAKISEMISLSAAPCWGFVWNQYDKSNDVMVLIHLSFRI